MNTNNIYAIRYVSQKTGLSPHVIRAWEKRYQAVVPQRSPKNRRLFCEDDIQRLQLLSKLTEAGHSISQIAPLDSKELLDLAQRVGTAVTRTRADSSKSLRSVAAGEHCKACLSAVINLDPDALEYCFDQAAIDLTRPELLRDVIVPLFQEIGSLWRKGSLKIANEHMATYVTRNFLVSMLRATTISDPSPGIFIATLVGQWHDIGALIIALTAAENGWHPIYYGPNLPSEEIAAVVKQTGASALAISIIYLLDQHSMVEELRKLRRYVGKALPLFVGGRAVEVHIQVLKEVNAKYISDIDQFREELSSFPQR
jgi:DNA-binding transcriptional MerR regulator/methylmalonyl-CoA mutase cobalamin-binding subunit